MDYFGCSNEHSFKSHTGLALLPGGRRDGNTSEVFYLKFLLYFDIHLVVFQVIKDARQEICSRSGVMQRRMVERTSYSLAPPPSLPVQGSL